MTSQLLISTSESSSSNAQSAIEQSQSTASSTASSRDRLMKSLKSAYQADQQAKFLHLQAEAEALLEHLKTLQQQRLAAMDEQVPAAKELVNR